MVFIAVFIREARLGRFTAAASKQSSAVCTAFSDLMIDLNAICVRACVLHCAHTCHSTCGGG